MVAGYHLIWTAYGWWLPNDPRGSNSSEIRVEKLEPLGDIHFGRKKIQPPSREVKDFYRKAQDLLTHPLLTFEADDLPLLGAAVDRVIRENGYTCYECAIMPDHVHMLIRRHRDHAEVMIEKLQNASREDVIKAQRRGATHPVWGGPGWRVFLGTKADFERTIKYIRNNPIKIGWPVQNWSFVTLYDGWLPRPAK